MKLTFIPFEIGNIVLFENVSECQNSILLYSINENKTFFPKCIQTQNGRECYCKSVCLNDMYVKDKEQYVLHVSFILELCRKKRRIFPKMFSDKIE